MFNQKYVNDYIKIIKEDEKSYKKDYEKMLDKREEYGATYKGQVVPTLYQGFFYDQETEDIYKKIVDKFMSIVAKVTKKYCEDPDYRKLFDFDELTEKLILKDPGYHIDIPISRIDVMYDGREDFKFCEVNTDGSSAMLEDRAIAEIYKETKAYKEFSKKYDLENINLLTSLVDSILDLYKTVDDKKPNLAIVDIIEFDNIEFQTIKKLFEKRDINTKIVDVRDLTKKEDGLYYEDFKIDLVYRRLVTSDLIENKDSCKDFIESYLAGDFISIGSFRTTIFYTKDIFRILRLKETQEILTKEENDFIKNHIPFTESFNYKKGLDFCLANKDKLIFKPKQAYASHGVFAGKDLSKEDLKKELEKIKDQDYIYQEYYKVDPMQFLVFDEDKAKLEDFSFVTGLFVYNNKMIAPYMRIGNQSLISSARDYYTITSMKISKKLDK
jgi:hypothetical protein